MEALCQQLEKVVRQWPELESVSFLHGMLTGQLCGADQLTPSDFIGGLLRELEVRSISEQVLNLLYQLYEKTRAGLTSSQFDLKLCLVPDEASLQQRAQAVADWASGFVYGFGMSHPGQRDLSDEVKEYLEVVMEVSGMDIDALASVEDAQLDAQLEEVAEFLRIGAIAVYENLHPNPQQPAMDTIPEPTHRTIQ